MPHNELEPRHFTTLAVAIHLPANTREHDQDALCRIYENLDIRQRVQTYVRNLFDAYTHIPITVNVED